jgi:hypothetical protein
MRRIHNFLIVGLLAVGLTGTASAQAADKKIDVSGKWLFSVTSELGTGTPTVTMKQSGDSLSGHYSSATFGEVDFKGTFKDRKIVFSLNASAQGTQLTVTYSGQMDGENAMKGSVDFGGAGTGTFTARRQQP